MPTTQFLTEFDDGTYAEVGRGFAPIGTTDGNGVYWGISQICSINSVNDEYNDPIGDFQVCHSYGNMYSFVVYSSTIFLFLLVVGFIVKYFKK